MKTIHILATLLAIAPVIGREAPPEARPGRSEKADERRLRRESGERKYSIEQATSDKAQLHTIGFSGLAFITGDFGASTFVPRAKYATTSASNTGGTSTPRRKDTTRCLSTAWRATCFMS